MFGVDLVVPAFAQLPHYLGELVVLVGRALCLAGDDQGGTRFVDQDIIDLVDDREIQAALDLLLAGNNHVVAQIVEPKFIVGSVGDVCCIGFAALDRPQKLESGIGRLPVGVENERLVMLNAADAQTQPVIDSSHPLCVATSEVVVNRDDVDTVQRNSVQRHGARRRERFSFSGFHLRDLALMEHNAAHQLDVEVALAQAAARRLPH